MRRFSLILLTLLGMSAVGATPAFAQFQVSSCKFWQHQSLSVVGVEGEKGEKGHWKLIGKPDQPVIVDCDTTQLVADEMEIFSDEHRVIATGHVVYVSSTNRIAAERMEFNTKTKTGTFYEASGTAYLGDRVDRSMFGTQEPYAYFYGSEIHKLGPKKFRIVRGGFTTCVQPTPRWEITSGSVTIVLENHAILTNSIFKVKGVPVMYLPAFYYPIQKDDRATGFLMPIYGNSLYRGQTLTNQFFWAISRSQDATLTHDWYTKTGQGYGGEYRYVASGSSNGTVTASFLREKAVPASGQTAATPGKRDYDIRSNVTHALPFRTRLTANVDYFSSVTTQQLYQQDLYRATNARRNWSAGTSSSWSGFLLSTSYSRSELFFDTTNSHVDGTRPRINFSRSATRLGRSPVYVSGNFDFVARQDEDRRKQQTGTVIASRGLTRIDGIGSMRVPFPTFSFMTVTSTLSWNGTRYSKSQEPNVGIVPEPLFRKYLSAGTEVIGPSFVRIFDRPGSSSAARMKHLIEPRVEFTRTTLVDNRDRIVKYDSSDFLFGGTTQVRYSATNRLLVKPAGERAASRNLLSVSVGQTYYSNAKTSQIDPNYGTSFSGRAASHFSAVSIQSTYNPAVGSRVNGRLEYDPIIAALQSVSIGGEASGQYILVNGNFSHRRLSQTKGPSESSNTINAGTQIHTSRNMLGGTYTIDYDFRRGMLVQQRIQGYYNAQCCGLILEFQQFQYGTQVSSLAIPQDKRFNISFALGGIGTFSNFLGALAGQPTRR